MNIFFNSFGNLAHQVTQKLCTRYLVSYYVEIPPHFQSLRQWRKLTPMTQIYTNDANLHQWRKFTPITQIHTNYANLHQWLKSTLVFQAGPWMTKPPLTTVPSSTTWH
jgi:hypothetical protein